MVDRMHPYSMFPQNLASSSLQQPQIPQQPPQSQQPDPQMLSALSNPEHSRMWQLQNQLQNAYRPQQSGDLTSSQMNHQMQEFVRGQALSHGQGQPIVQQIQQSFGLNAQRINPSGPVFHDPQANLSQLLMPTNSPNVAMNTQQQMKNPFNMNPMMHTMNNPGVPRQLNMLKQQQEMARLQQSSLGAQHAPNQTAADMFVSNAMQPSHDQMHGSPHPAAQSMIPPGANQGMVPGNQQQNAGKRMVTQAEFQERRNYLFNLYSQSEANLASLVQSVRSANSFDPHTQQKIGQLRNELATRKDMYNKFMTTFGAMLTQQIANGIPTSNVPHMNPMTHAASQQQPQQGPVSNPQIQPGFVSQASQSVTAQYNIPAGSGPSPMPTQGQGPLNQQLPMTGTPIGRPNTIPPRTGNTPHQAPGGQLPNSASPNLGNFAPQGGQKVPNPNQSRQSPGSVMPLDKPRFDSTYRSFCRSQSISADLRVPIGDNRSVDLHQLHVCVMHEGGASSVTQRDLWAVIGGRLNFVQFPGNDSEPARSGPGIAQQLQNTYEQYLQHFENAYIMTVKNRSGAGSPQQPMHQINPNALPVGNSATPNLPGNPAEMTPNVPRPVFNPQLIAMAARYAHTSAQEMRAQRVHDQLINFVERHRSELAKVHQHQTELMAKRSAEQERQNSANAQGQMSNVPEQQHMGLQPSAQRPHQAIAANNMVGIPPGEGRMVNGNLVSENATATLNQQPPTQEQIRHATMAIHQLKTVFQQRSLAGMSKTYHIPDEQRLEYNQVLEQAYKMTSEMDRKLHLYYAVFKSEEVLRKYVAIVMTVARQRQLLSTSSPQYIIPLANLRNMQLQVHKLNEEFENRWRAVRPPNMAAAASSQQHATLTSAPAHKTAPSPLSVPPVQNTSQIVPPVSLNNGRPVATNPSPPQQTHLQPPPAHPQSLPPPPPQSHPQPNQPPPRPPSVSQPNKKPFHIPRSPSAQPASTNLASSTPPAVASSSTPATNAPTPQTTAGSPQTPKSPPSKAASRGKGAGRVTRKLSTAGKGSATPETTPSTVAGVKRPPEEDVSTFTSVAPSEAEASNAPSPKKAKTDWEGETSEALVKKQQELNNIKTEDDATAFFDQMKELFAMSATTNNDIHHDIASSLDQILAGVAQEPADAAATAAALAVHGAGDTGPPPTALSPHMGAANEAFLEFIDFSSFTTLDDEDNDSKAPTPDLVHSSEGISPESGSEGDSLGSNGSPDKAKIEETSDRSDPLRLGSLREIDGGESAYYQTDNWKWEGPMHTVDQPWAIFTS